MPDKNSLDSLAGMPEVAARWNLQDGVLVKFRDGTHMRVRGTRKHLMTRSAKAKREGVVIDRLLTEERFS